MRETMSSEVAGLSEGAATVLAFERLFTRVDALKRFRLTNAQEKTLGGL